MKFNIFNTFNQMGGKDYHKFYDYFDEEDFYNVVGLHFF